MKTVMRVMESLVKMNGWTVTRFDLQHFNYNGIEGYAGYLDTQETERIVIHDDGSFEYSIR